MNLFFSYMFWLTCIHFNINYILSFSIPPKFTHYTTKRKQVKLNAYTNQISEHHSSPDFNYLRTLKDRCATLSQYETEYMLSFWSEKLNCFQIHSSMSEASRVSVTTTCLSVDALLSNPSAWEGICRWDEINDTSQQYISLKLLVHSLLSAPWSGDSFQTPVLISTLCKLKSIDFADVKCRNAVDNVLNQRSRLSMHRKQPNSAYLRHLNIQALKDIANTNIIQSDFKLSNEVGYALERANMVSFDELCRQLAFYNSGDSANFDVIVLTYSLLSYWDTSTNLFLGSFVKGVIPPTNIKLVTSALKVIFDNQAEDGTWRKGEPILGKGDNSTREGNRDIGNSYVFFFDLIGSLLGSIAEKQPDILAPYLPNFERCLSWAENNCLQEMLTDFGCDPSTQLCAGRVVKGWRSNHLGTGGAVGWCTAQVFTAVSRLGKLLQTLINTNILTEFNGRKAQSQSMSITGNAKVWDGLMDSDLQLAGKTTSLKKEVLERLLLPQLMKERSTRLAFQPIDEPSTSTLTPSNTHPVTSFSPIYSSILFGPPGTAKTTFCTSIATYLGWNFITIDTAMFLSYGLEQIASRITYIFDRLKLLDRTIILFDEIEEFCLDRENPALTMESRMLTTAMLTQLNDLRRHQSCIFIVATNRLRSFDAAVTRPGRFDMVLFVGTPNLQSRIQRLVDKLRHKTRPSLIASTVVGTNEATLQCFADFMVNNWNEMRFLTFAENEALINCVIELQARQELSVSSIEEKARLLLRTSTIQGPIKEEYIASEVLSRA